jgi:hypothetical protein
VDLLTITTVLLSSQTFAPEWEPRLEEHLASALRAPTVEEAEAILTRCRGILDDAVRGQRVDPLSRTAAELMIESVRGQARLRAWQRSENDRESFKGEARRTLEHVVQGYGRLQADCLKRRNELLTHGGKSATSRTAYQLAKDCELTAQSERAWAESHLSELVESGSRNQLLEEALDCFHQLIARSGCDSGPNRSRGNWNWQPWVLYCFRGEASCLLALKRYEEVRECLIEKLGIEKACQKAVRDARRPVCASLLLLLGRACEAEGTAHSSEVFETSATAYFAVPPEPPFLHEELESQLLRLKNLKAQSPTSELDASARYTWVEVMRSIDAAGEAWARRVDEVLCPGVIAGLLEAHGHDSAKDHARVLELTEKLLSDCQHANSGRLSPSQRDARLLRVNAARQLGDWPETIRSVLEFLENHAGQYTDETGRKLCALAFAAIEQARTLSTADLDGVFARLHRVRPDDLDVRKVAWYRGRERLKRGEFADAERILSAADASSGPGYFYCQMGLVKACLEQARSPKPAAGAAEASRVEDLQRAEDAVRRFAFGALDELPDVDRNWLVGQVTALAVDVARGWLVTAEPPRATSALHLLRLIEGPGFEVAADTRASERKALTFVCEALAAGDQEHRTPVGPAQANTVVPLLFSLTTTADGLDVAGRHHDAEQLSRGLLRLYESCLEQFESSAAEEVALRTAAARLAVRLGETGRALAQADRGLQVLRDQERMRSWERIELERLQALAHQAAKNFGSAAEKWRLLSVVLLTQEHDLWHEAHYERIRCYLAQGERANARKLHHDYELLGGRTQRGEKWRAKFQSLVKELTAQ